MGLKDSLKRLFSTTKTVGTEKVEQTIDQVKEFTHGNTAKADEAISQTKEKVKDMAADAEAKVVEVKEKIQQKVEETTDQIQAKLDELWENIDEKAAQAVDKLEAKIRGDEPATEEVNAIQEETTEEKASEKDQAGKPSNTEPKV
jgi:ABC-type transporter Mla subunit MlaD